MNLNQVQRLMDAVPQAISECRHIEALVRPVHALEEELARVADVAEVVGWSPVHRQVAVEARVSARPCSDEPEGRVRPHGIDTAASKQM